MSRLVTTATEGLSEVMAPSTPFLASMIATVIRRYTSQARRLLVPVLFLAALPFDVAAESPSVPTWQTLDVDGLPHARHEAALVECADRLYLLGGRGIKPVDIFDPKTKSWTQGARPPMEIHHFQPVVWEGKILIAGAMTGSYPKEMSLDRVLIYDPSLDRWSWGAEIPKHRRRGGAGAVADESGLYLVCGIQNGHWDGWVPWLDRLDLATGDWQQLPDAPRERDHFQAVIVGKKLYAVGGRRSSASTKQVFDLTIQQVDVFDLAENQWSTLPPETNFPVPRAGCFSISIGSQFLVAGGESSLQRDAHRQVHAFDTQTNQWRLMSQLNQGRHGTGIVQWNGNLYTVGGSGRRGGRPELDSTERLSLATSDQTGEN